MERNFPTSLFRYRAFDEAGRNIEALKSRKLWFSLCKNFNDPFDCRPPMGISSRNLIRSLGLDHGVSDSDYEGLDLHMRSYLESETQNPESGMYEVVREIQSHIYSTLICCLSTEANNTLMWSYYAESHTGFCIEYDAQILLNDLDIFHHDFVTYDNKVPDFGEAITSTPEKEANVFCNKVLTQKSPDWAHEKEYRLILGKSGSQSLTASGEEVSKEAVKAIYFGLNASEENKALIVDCEGLKGVRFYQAVRGPNSFNVSMQLVD